MMITLVTDELIIIITRTQATDQISSTILTPYNIYDPNDNN